VLGITNTLTVAVAALVLLGAPAAVGMPLLFGFVRHSGATPSDVVRTRAVFSMAWVSGPPVAAAIIASSGGHALVYAIGAVGILVLLCLTSLRRAPVTTDDATSSPQQVEHNPRVPRAALAALIAAFATLQAANTASVAITTLFVTRSLHLSAIWGGIALGVAAGLEVPALMLIGRQSARSRELLLIALAGVLGAAYYLLAAVAPNGVALIGFQVFNAASYALIAGVGLTLFQSLIAGPGAAAGLLSNAQRAGALMAGPLIGVGSLINGSMRTVFVVCAVVSLAGLVLVRVAASRLAADH
jgi:SET family sugar efflux transporter-like MFS transporter